MKTSTHLLAAAASLVLFAAQSNAQTQTTPKTDSGGEASTPKVQAPAVTPADKTAASPGPTAAKSSRKSTLSRKTRKVPPPPPVNSVRPKRAVKKTQTTPDNTATELDQHGRIDNAGKHVGFYPSVRGASSSKSQGSATREGRKITKKASTP
jgi:hypothetical protein